ncbi:MAG: bacillithiol system redox-active protein YtxJ [Nanoarchaeota archaeon]|nr:bacillithiol system redox-active protein YtxJ [Nanoarchaeota archaeon]
MFKQILSLSSVLEKSSDRPVFILRHSSTCPFSVAGNKQVEEYMKTSGQNVYRVIVQTERPLSNEIASTLGIKHESPQLIGLKKRKPYFVLNYSDITKEDIGKNIK